MNTGQGNWSLPIGFSVGVLLAHQFVSLPPDWLILAALLSGLIFLYWHRTRWAGALLLALCWTLWHFNLQLDQRLDPSLIGQTVQLEGVVSTIPQVFPAYTRFRFVPRDDQSGPGLPAAILVYWYRNAPLISVGQTWRLELHLKPPWGKINFAGPDREKWLFAQGIGALGTVRGGLYLRSSTRQEFPLQRTRSWVNNKIKALVHEERSRSIVQALAIAETGGLSTEDRQLLTATGTSHLLAISGLHIGLAATGGALLARLLLSLLPLSLPGNFGYRAPLLCGLLAAVIYSGLAGWGVSTLRALLMIAVVMSALLLSRAINPVRTLVLALALVLLIDPHAPLGAGFWFSFLAVTALIMLFFPRKSAMSWWKTLLLAQAGVMLALLPVSISWFQVFSPVGFLANLVAIPWVSLVVVPLVLAGMSLLVIWDVGAGFLLNLAAVASSSLLTVLEKLAHMQGDLSYWPVPGHAVLTLAVMGGLLLMLPRGLPLRWLGPFFIIPLFLPPNAAGRGDSLQIDVLDVGQGTSILVSTADHTLLYDSGPGDGEDQNQVGSVIVPALSALGRRAPDRIVISHGDLDHAGGLKALESRFPGARWSANLNDPGGMHEPCHTGQQWQWDGMAFGVLHPSGALPYMGNDSSCVLSIRGLAGSVLLAGDISRVVEDRILSRGLRVHQLLLVPHHGSSTSSSHDFIARVKPELAIASTGLGNRFGFPREEVRKRYLAAGSRFWSSGDCGAARVLLSSEGELRVQSARRVRQRIWRWPAAPECP